jgi:hypothetical protein
MQHEKPRSSSCQSRLGAVFETAEDADQGVSRLAAKVDALQDRVRTHNLFGPVR